LTPTDKNNKVFNISSNLEILRKNNASLTKLLNGMASNAKIV